MKSYFFIILVLLGCEQQPQISENQNRAQENGTLSSPEKSGPGKSAEEILKLTLLPRKNPNEYEVSVDWENASSRSDGWTLQRSDSQWGFKELGIFPESVRTFLDSDVVADHFYTYFFSRHTDNGEQQVIAVKTLRIPKDFVVEEKVNGRDLPLLESFARVFLEKDSKILIGTDHVSLKINELISRGGQILAFDAPAPAQEEGMASGRLEMYVEKASGDLTLIADGQKGGQGPPGIAAIPGKPGVKGKNASYSHSLAYLFAHSPAQRKEKMEELNKRLAPCDHEWRRYFECRSEASDGTGGSDAQPAGEGGDGKNGGSSLAGILEIKKTDNFHLTFSNLPGAGGDGGPGGAMAAGGPGGAAGREAPHCVCSYRPRPGPNGKGAETGKTGRAGAPGKQRRFCVKTAENRSSDCF